MNILDAAHKTVKEYPGGSESLGPRIDMSAAVLRSKVNPNIATHHLTLLEADEIMSVTGDHRMLHALAAQHGYVLQRIDAAGGPADLLGALLACDARKGELTQLLHDSLADGNLSPNEWSQVAQAGTATQAALVILLQRLQAMAEQKARA